MELIKSLKTFWKTCGWYGVLAVICVIIIIAVLIDNWRKRSKENHELFQNIQNNIKHQAYQGIKNLNLSAFFVKLQKLKKSESKKEAECRRILQELYGCSFINCRPDFMKNPDTGKNLELDCYNSKLKLAIEYDGIQHRKFCPYFHKSYQDFEKQKRRDAIKDWLCKQNGITLIRVPDTVKKSQLKQYLMIELTKNGRL